MTYLLRGHIALFALIILIAGLSCGVEENGDPTSVEADRESLGVPTDEPGNQSNRRISITNDEASLENRVRITSQDVQIDPVTTSPGSSSLMKRYRYQAAVAKLDTRAAEPTITLASLRSSAGRTAFAMQASLPNAFLSNANGQANAGSSSMAAPQAAQALILTLVAEVESPMALGQTLQASSVSIKGKYAYVSYNMRGETYLGAIDVIDISKIEKPKLVSQAIFLDSDIHSLTFEEDKVYAAQATNDPDFDYPAVFESISVKKGKLVLEGNERGQLPSFAGTSVAVSGDGVYVISGDEGGLSVFNKKNLELKAQIELHDARWVDVQGDKVVVVQGTPGQISVFNKKNLELVNTFQFKGADIPESKSTVQVVGKRAFIAAGTGGAQVIDIETGKVLATVPRPEVLGLDPSVAVTNAVSADGNLVFMSNGEAGVYVAQAPKNFNAISGDDPLELTLLGKLQFQNLQSVNHVEYRGKVLFVAAGLGGLKILKVENEK